jgi:hypothetical protein
MKKNQDSKVSELEMIAKEIQFKFRKCVGFFLSTVSVNKLSASTQETSIIL